jgi:LPS export ABC transporter protein LptC
VEALRIHTLPQKLFAGGLAFFLLSMLVTAYSRSSVRKSILTSTAAFGEQQSVFSQLEDDANEGSKLELQDFHRVEVKNGQPSWEVKASDAKYFPEHQVTHVNHARVRIYREKDSSIGLLSRAATLRTSGDAVTQAELQGEVRVEFSESMELQTELAVYTLATREITAPGEVHITGRGFDVKGIGMEFDVDKQIVKLNREVYSYFAPEAKIPKNVRIAPN